MDTNQIKTWLRNFLSSYNIPVSIDDDGKVLNKPVYAEAYLNALSNIKETYGGQNKKVSMQIDINIYSSRPYDISSLKQAFMGLKDTDIPTVTIENITFRKIEHSPSFNQWNVGIDVTYLI